MSDVTAVEYPERPLILRQFCRTCKDEIVMQIFLGTGVCCELCRKVDVGEISAEEWIGLKFAWMPRKEEVNVDGRASENV